MALATTSTAALNGATPAGSLSITSPNVNAGFAQQYTPTPGTPTLPVYAGAPIATQAGIYIQASPDFVGNFLMTRHPSGMQAAESTGPGQSQRSQLFLHGDQTFLFFAGLAALAQLTATDTVTLTVVGYQAGSMTMAVVQ